MQSPRCYSAVYFRPKRSGLSRGIPVNDDVLRAAPTGDDFGSAVAIEIADFEVLAGHVTGVDVGDQVPRGAVGVGPVELNAHGIIGASAAPAGDD